MTISPIKVIGALIYRTREVLNANKDFLAGLHDYEYADLCCYGNCFNLWHYPGTPEEIAGIFGEIKDSGLKFPSVFNFQAMRQQLSGNMLTVTYNLAFTAITGKDWTTEQRDEQTFDLVLRPVLAEFFRQVSKCGYFIGRQTNYTRYDVYTTGNSKGIMYDRYGDYIDAIEVQNLALNLNMRLCHKDIERIEHENNSVVNLKKQC